MEIKHKELIPDKDNPFANCKLDRAKYASVLTNIVETYAEGFVLALDGKWGTGKTTFVRMWESSLSNTEFKTIYFNAWENDFENEPLVALMGEMKKLSGKIDNSTFKELLKKGTAFTKKILPSVAKALTKKHLGDDIAEIISEGVGAASELFEDEVNNYLLKKESLQAFKIELEKYISENNNGKPVVIIIDELDRCRPDYAVEVLEKVKHFFSVKGIVFVLSVDKIQLGHSIKGYYGNDNIDTNEYLRRFIDLEYQLPEPNVEVFCKYLFDYFEYDKFFKDSQRANKTELRSQGSDFLNLAINLFKDNTNTLRQIEKNFALGRVVLNSFGISESVYPEVLVVLLYLKQWAPDFYSKIQSRSLSIQDLVTEYEMIFNSKLQKTEQNEDNAIFIYTESKILIYYAKFLSQKLRGHEPNLYTRNDTDLTLKFESMYNEELVHVFNGIERSSMFFFRISLELILNKINLTDSIR